MQLQQGILLYGNQYHYKIEKVLGQGAFGITYLASVTMQGALGSLDTNVKVTIKEFFMKEINGREGTSVTASSTGKGGLFYDYKQKFSREAKNLSKLKHSNIVKVMDYFEANNTCYYVMEFLSGGDLDTLIEQRGGLSEEDTIRYTKQIGSALSFMHQNKMLHLDLKPKNVMINSKGEAILIDFGLSKQYDGTGEPESSTTVGRGTPGYAPLEQANYQDGHGFPVTMDVYALGATMYKMITGKRAPEASVILNEGFPRYMLEQSGVSASVIDCIEKSMSPIKKNRYQDVGAMMNTLHEEPQRLPQGLSLFCMEHPEGNALLFSGNYLYKINNARHLSLQDIPTCKVYKKELASPIEYFRNTNMGQYSFVLAFHRLPANTPVCHSFCKSLGISSFRSMSAETVALVGCIKDFMKDEKFEYKCEDILTCCETGGGVVEILDPSSLYDGDAKKIESNNINVDMIRGGLIQYQILDKSENFGDIVILDALHTSFKLLIKDEGRVRDAIILLEYLTTTPCKFSTSVLLSGDSIEVEYYDRILPLRIPELQRDDNIEVTAECDASERVKLTISCKQRDFNKTYDIIELYNSGHHYGEDEGTIIN